MRTYFLAALSVVLFIHPVSAAVPGRINFQGRLLDASKLPRNGTFTMDFRVCDAVSGGSCAMWSESQSVAVSNGVFAVQLGAVSALSASVFSSSARYLEVDVDAETLSPRERLVTGPYAFRSELAEGLAGQTINRALATDGSGNSVASAVTDTELGYVSGVTSAIQTQFSGKQNTITGAATTITGVDLTTDRALMSNGSGKVAVSAVTATELGYVSGVTSALQTQLNAKQATVTGGATTITGSDLTASRALASNGSGKVAVSAVTDTELGYVGGVTSALQTQLDAKAPLGVLVNIAVYTSGSGCPCNWAKPGGVTRIFVETIGGGAGAGSAYAAVTGASVGSGGGAGGYAAADLNVSAVTDPVVVTVGGNGTGGTNAACNSGTVGTASSFGAYVAANGGTNGTCLASAATLTGQAGGAGGVGTAGDVLLAGGQGCYSNRFSATLGIPGCGGTSARGPGAAAPNLTALNTSNAGLTAGANSYGAGGSGAFASRSAGGPFAAAGGDGADGLVVIWEYR